MATEAIFGAICDVRRVCVSLRRWPSRQHVWVGAAVRCAVSGVFVEHVDAL